MSYKFKRTRDIANDIKSLLKTARDDDDALIFKDVRVIAVTSYEQLFKTISHLSRFPAAVVCVGTGRFNDDVDVRTINPGILIVDEFGISAESRAAGIWDALDATIDLFVPNADRDLKEVNGVTYIPRDFRSITLKNSRNSAYLLEIKVIAVRGD